MLVSCSCGAFQIDPTTASYIKNDKPVCNNVETCRKVLWHNQQNYRRVPLASRLEANLAA